MDLKEIRRLVDRDPELKKMEISDFELLTAYRYLRLKQSNDNPNYIPILKRNGDLEIVMVPTEQFDKEIQRRKQAANVGSLDTVNYILDAKLADFVLNSEERNEAYLKVSRFIDLFKEGKANRGLYLHGKYGTGKTYLLSAIVEELSSDYKVYFIYFPDLVRSMKSSISTNELEAQVTALKTCDLLIFDDVGSENMTPWFRDEILAPILQFRLASGLPLLISSNFPQQQLLNIMAVGNNELDRTKSMRIVHRIVQLTETISLNIPYQP